MRSILLFASLVLFAACDAQSGVIAPRFSRDVACEGAPTGPPIFAVQYNDGTWSPWVTNHFATPHTLSDSVQVGDKLGGRSWMRVDFGHCESAMDSLALHVPNLRSYATP